VIRMNENEPGKRLKYYGKTKDGKLALRKVMERYIPQEITGAVKQGFSGPDGSWFKGESIDYLRQLFFDNNAQIFNYMDSKTVRSLLSEHIEGKHNRRLLIWSFLSAEWWLRKYMVE